jgi:hypothetical protein
VSAASESWAQRAWSLGTLELRRELDGHAGVEGYHLRLWRLTDLPVDEDDTEEP